MNTNYYSKTLSPQLIKKLESAFDNLKADIKNPLIIALIKYSKEGEQVYLIAKDPDKETYYGIMEGQFAGQKQICAIPVSNITYEKKKNEPLTACKQCCLAAGATQGNIAYTQTVRYYNEVSV